MARAFQKRKYHKPTTQATLPITPAVQRGPRDHSYKPIEFHCCVEGCQKYASYGYGVKLRAGRVGVWACEDPSHQEKAKAEWQRNFHQQL